MAKAAGACGVARYGIDGEVVDNVIVSWGIIQAQALAGLPGDPMVAAGGIAADTDPPDEVPPAV